MKRMIRATRFWMVGLLVILAATCARAADSKFSLSVLADGVSLGTASGTLSVTAGSAGNVAWSLADGKFAERSDPDSKLVWAEDMLTGSGTIKPTGTFDLKDFDITVRQSTGVDVTYRFRLSATLAEGVVKSLTIAQVK